MREWWNNLSLREKQVVFFGTIFVSFLFIYVIIWLPLTSKNTALRDQIHRQQELLAWMQDADKRIQLLEKSTQPKITQHTSGSLLSVIQKQLNRTPLVSSLNQLHQAENNSVQLTFQKVDFDKLMTWLIQLTQQEEITITQMTVTPGTTPGIVTAELVLKA